MSLTTIAYRLSTEPGFFQRLQLQPEQTLVEEGLEINADEMQGLKVYLSSTGSQPLNAIDPGDGIPLINPWYLG